MGELGDVIENYKIGYNNKIGDIVKITERWSAFIRLYRMIDESQSIPLKFPMEVETYTVLEDQDPCNRFKGKIVRINRFSTKRWIDVSTGVEMESTVGFHGALLDDNLNETGEETPLMLFEEIEEVLCT